jgi:glycosyltransferase involved in cell wall biosynthesis
MNSKPTFAFVTIGSGSYVGSTVRDLILANALHRRGFKVLVYWMMECKPDLVADGIRQRMLCYGPRYHFRRPSEVLDKIIGPLLFRFPASARVRVAQGMPGYADRLLENLTRCLHETPDSDRLLVKRLMKFIALDGVSHLMMSFAAICPIALAAKKNSAHPVDYLVTFQGDEHFANYARKAGVYAEFHQRVKAVVRGSRWPAVVVSQDYLNRISEEMDLDPECLRVIYNGIELPGESEKLPFSTLETAFPNLTETAPIVTYVGRQDTEKGIDLLLYAAKLLEARQIPIQLVVCGATAKGRSYQDSIGDIADHLRLSIHHAGPISLEIRDALYAHSRCVVYPSVCREPFGLVAVEAMSYGTPVLVPDYGGITEVIRHGEKAGGLTFKTWNSEDLAQQLERLLTDEMLHRKLTENTRAIAARFSAEEMADAVLAHIGVDTREYGDNGVLPSFPNAVANLVRSRERITFPVNVS